MVPRGPGQEEQQRRDRGPDDAGGFSDLEKLSKKDHDQESAAFKRSWRATGGRWQREAWSWASRDK